MCIINGQITASMFAFLSIFQAQVSGRQFICCIRMDQFIESLLYPYFVVLHFAGKADWGCINIVMYLYFICKSHSAMRGLCIWPWPVYFKLPRSPTGCLHQLEQMPKEMYICNLLAWFSTRCYYAGCSCIRWGLCTGLHIAFSKVLEKHLFLRFWLFPCWLFCIRNM